MTEQNYYLAFSVFPGIGPKRFGQLLSFFASAEKAWTADEESFRESGLGEKTTAHLLEFRRKFSMEKYIEQLTQKEVTFICLQPTVIARRYDEAIPLGYPEMLKQISNPPFVLYCKGNVSLLSSRPEHQRSGGISDQTSGLVAKDSSTTLGMTGTIGVVGTRKITDYGRQVTQMFTTALVDAGFVIVSGLAMGVDAVAHQTTIENNGKTIAVLSCGVDCANPPSNQRLYEEIIAKDGLIISEFPLSVQPSVGSFPSRNRIIAGLSSALLVTEGAEDSGALITAEDSFALSRPVFAVPGQITSSLAKGPLKLLQKGAKLATDPADILTELGAKEKSIKSTKGIRSIKGDTAEEQKIIDLLASESKSFDEIVREIQIDPATLAILLSMMELKGMVRIGEQGRYALH